MSRSGENSVSAVSSWPRCPKCWDGGAKAYFEAQLELPKVERHPSRGPLYGTLDQVAWEVRRLVGDLEATVVPTVV